MVKSSDEAHGSAAHDTLIGFHIIAVILQMFEALKQECPSKVVEQQLQVALYDYPTLDIHNLLFEAENAFLVDLSGRRATSSIQPTFVLVGVALAITQLQYFSNLPDDRLHLLALSCLTNDNPTNVLLGLELERRGVLERGIMIYPTRIWFEGDQLFIPEYGQVTLVRYIFQWTYAIIRSQQGQYVPIWIGKLNTLGQVLTQKNTNPEK